MGSRQQPDFEALIARVAGRLQERRIPFMLIGGQAVLLHGEPRLTLDIDITVGASPDRLPDLLAVCDACGLDPLPEDVAAFVRDTYVLPAAEETGVRVDFVFSTTPYEAQAIARAVTVLVGGELVPFASAEDLILHKLFAGRPRDLEDAAGVVRRRGEELDWNYLETWAEAFGEVPGREGMAAAVRSLRSGIGPT